MIGANFHHYSVAYGLMIVRLHTFIIGFRLTPPLSQAPLLWQDELTRRKRDLDTRGLSVRLHTLYNQVPARIPPIASKDSLDETSSPSVAQRLRTGSCPFGFTPCPNQAQTSNKAHDKFVPRRDCACADHSRPSLSPALLSGWSSHLVNPYTFAQSTD